MKRCWEEPFSGDRRGTVFGTVPRGDGRKSPGRSGNSIASGPLIPISTKSKYQVYDNGTHDPKSYQTQPQYVVLIDKRVEILI